MILLVILLLIVVAYFSYSAGRFHEIERWLEEKIQEFAEDDDGDWWKKGGK